ncbi:MAG: hypothetical protein ACI8SJ_000819, partial [Shewanella sp.]
RLKPKLNRLLAIKNTLNNGLWLNKYQSVDAVF